MGIGNSQWRAAAQDFLGTDRFWRQLKLVPFVYASAHFDELHHYVLEVRGDEVRRSEHLRRQMGPV